MITFPGVTIKQVEASVDWFTGTAKTARSRNEVATLFDFLKQEELRRGNKLSLWSQHGYDGVSIGGLSWGRRDKDDIVRLSGPYAGLFWEEFSPNCSFCSRVDLAVTVWTKPDLRGLALSYYKAVECDKGPNQNTRRYGIVQDLWGGSTLYVGSRSSYQYGRMYDKGKESQDPRFKGSWRYEVEFKKPLSDQVRAKLVGREDREAAIASTVYHWFEERGVPPVFDATAVPIAMEVSRSKPDAQRKLEWIRRQVAPTMIWLVASGHSEELGSILTDAGIRL